MRRAFVAAVVVATVAGCRGCDRPAPVAGAGVDAGPPPAVDEARPDALGDLPRKPKRSTVTYLSRRDGRCEVYADDLLARHPVRLTNDQAECPDYAVDEGGSLLLWHDRRGPVTWLHLRSHQAERLPPLGNALDAYDYGFVRGAPAAVATGPLLPSHPKTMLAELEDGGIEDLPVPDDLQRAVVLRLEDGEWKVAASREYEPDDDDDGVSDLLDPEDLGPRTTLRDYDGIEERDDVPEPLPKALRQRTGPYDEDWFLAWEQLKLSGVVLYVRTHRGRPDGLLLWRTAKGAIEEVPGCQSARRLSWREPWLACDSQLVDLRRREVVELGEADLGLLFVHREE